MSFRFTMGESSCLINLKSFCKAKCVSLFALVVFLSTNSLFVSAETSTAKPLSTQGADIRMLIDISGSMKKNDPANLRIPAVNLLTELIPNGDKAGVWTFGQWVNNLIKHKVVDDKWRVGAKEEAQKINSVALFTNIGAVLEKSSDDFYKKDKDFSKTHFILLTDGMVDIDKDPTKNTEERDRILSTVLNNFKEKGAKIHTVALSKNADQSLMEKLAVQTGGQSAVAENPEDLTRIFLQALDQAVPSEQVPIEGNEFVIDSSIEEFTALIFREPNSAPTQIVSPADQLYTKDDHGSDIKWYQDSGYELITVSRPLEGAWQIKADIQPDSRVTVVSNLQLNVTKLPVNFYAGDVLDVDVSFSEDGKLVTSPEFLSLLDIQLQLKTESNKKAKKSMTKGEVPEDGVFRESITKLSKIGQYEVSVLVDGKTFKRKNRQLINLRAPFDFEFAVKGEGEDAYYALSVSPMNESIDTKESSIFAKVNAPDGTSLINAVELDEDANKWVLPIRPDKGDGIYKVAVKVKAKTVEGKKFTFKPQPYEAVFPIPPGAANAIVSNNEPEEPAEELPKDALPEEPEVVEKKEEPKAEPIPEEVAPPEMPIEAPVEKAEEIEEEIEGSDETVDLVEEDSNLIWLLAGGGVLLALLIGGGLFYVLRKRKAPDEDEEILSDEDVEEISEEISQGEDESLDFVEEPPEEVPVLDEPEPEVVSEAPEATVDIDDELDEPLVDIEEDEIEPQAEEIPELTEEPEIPELVEEPEVAEEPELPEEPAEEIVEDLAEEADDDIVDLSSDDLSDVVEELEQEEFDESILEEAEETVDEEDLAADIAQAIEDAVDEPVEDLEQEIEQALDINDTSDDDDEDDDDEEFNLEDFDIGDTDDLSEDDEPEKDK